MNPFKNLAVGTALSTITALPVFAYDKGDFIIRSGFSSEDLPKTVESVATDPAGMFYPIPPEKIRQIMEQAIG